MINVSHVSKSYGERRALDDVTFSAADGAVTGFVGPNGAGKSTLLRIAAQLTRPTAGSVLVDGQDFAGAKRPGSTLGVFLSAEWIPAHLTALSFLTYLCDVQGVSRRRVDEVLELVDLLDDRQKIVRAFSLGMRQRLGIAAAVVSSPQNLILDEPINGLDPDGIQWLRAFVKSVALDGGAVLLSSHHMNELALVADDVVLLDGGRVVRSGPIAAFVSEDDQRTYVEVDDLEAALQILRSRGYDCEPLGRGAVVHATEPQEIGRLLFRAGAGVSHLRRLERSLEETYFDEISARQSFGGVA